MTAPLLCRTDPLVDSSLPPPKTDKKYQNWAHKQQPLITLTKVPNGATNLCPTREVIRCCLFNNLTTFRLKSLSDFKFLKVVNGTLKIKLIKFDIRTKNDRFPFFRLCLVEYENQFVIRQFARFRLAFLSWKVRQVII